jgi:hypothetical protein
MYIPYTAKVVVKDATINLKGLIIGNGRINVDKELSLNSLYQYLFNRNFIDKNTKFVL